MRRLNTRTSLISTVASASLIMYAIIIAIGAFAWPYAIETLVFVIQHREITIAWWQGAIIAAIPYIGRFSLIAAGVAYIATLLISTAPV